MKKWKSWYLDSLCEEDAFLDAGVSLPLSGPSLATGAALARSAGLVGPFYSHVPANSYVAGLYTLSGNGGPQVGAFNVSTNFPASFTVTNWDSITTINRTQALIVDWSGSEFERVTILISNNERLGSNLRIVNVNCENIPGALGTYTVPPEALAYLLPSSALLTVHGINQSVFSAPLAGGGRTDLALFNADLGVQKLVPVR